MNNPMTKTTSSRRSFFTKSAVVFGASALAAKIISAQTSTTTTTAAAATTDLDILNYALALENLEAAFYTMYVGKYSASDFIGSNTVPIFGTKVTGNITNYISAIRDHEVAHVAALTSTITSLGGTPVAACVYNFGVNNVNDFLMTAMALENTGVMAYDGAIAMISSPTVKQAAATIATVEARHASYLNVLNGALPFPSAFDTPKSMADVLAIAGQFISSCPAGSSPTTNPNGPTISGLSASITTNDPVVSFDLSGSAGAGSTAVSFMFTQVSGGLASITGVKASDPQVILLGGPGVYVFQVVITDKFGMTQTGRTTITLN
jgi:hypothetical protein